MKPPLLRSAALLSVLFSAGLALPARACSVCITHAAGAGVHGVGAQVLHRGVWLADVHFLSVDKSNAGENPGSRETQFLNQVGLGLHYGLTERLTLSTDLPYGWRALEATGEPRATSEGLGDASLGAQYQLPARPADTFLTAFFVELKLPTGENSQKSRGTLLEQHLQPGTGSVDATLGVSLTGELDQHGSLWFAGISGRLNGENGRGYHHGDAFFYRVGYSRPLGRHTTVVAELDGRYAWRDRTEDGTPDTESGGHVIYGALSLRHQLSDGLGLVATYQSPLIKNLNGAQREGSVVTVSVARAL